MEEVKQLCHLLRAHFFGVIKFKLDITWLVHFGRAWKRLNINGLHFIICQVILRGVWCRKWEGFAKFFMDEQSSGMRLFGSKWSRRAFTKWWDSVIECTYAVSGEYSKNGAKLRKGRGSWKIDRFLNCQLSNFKPCTWRKDHNPTIPPY